MIIVKLRGGLGNQLFQYAAGRRIAHDRGVPLKLDVSDYDGTSQRGYALDDFHIRAELATAAEISTIRGGSFTTWVVRSVGDALRPRYCRSVVRERRSFEYDANILRVGTSVYLEGYWQNEAYFRDIASLIREELRGHAPLSTDGQSLLATITADASAVSIHVRRGDYARDSRIGLLHGTLDASYYRRAAERIAQRVRDPSFYVFSDEPEWAAENLRLPGRTTIVSVGRADRPYVDFQLMRACRHHVTANSSFSWWAAWLASRADQIVIAPERWMRDPSYDTSTLLPVGWERFGT